MVVSTLYFILFLVFFCFSFLFLTCQKIHSLNSKCLKYENDENTISFGGIFLFSIDLFLTCVPPFLALLKLSFQFHYFLGRIFWRLEFQIQILRSLLQRLLRDHVFGLRKCKQIEHFWFKILRSWFVLKRWVWKY